MPAHSNGLAIDAFPKPVESHRFASHLLLHFTNLVTFASGTHHGQASTKTAHAGRSFIGNSISSADSLMMMHFGKLSIISLLVVWHASVPLLNQNGFILQSNACALFRYLHVRAPGQVLDHLIISQERLEVHAFCNCPVCAGCLQQAPTQTQGNGLQWQLTKGLLGQPAPHLGSNLASML